jgi:cell division protein FtsI/penicillin-binding protein 2
LVLVALLIVGRLVKLQVVEHDRWAAAARATQERTIEIPPQRGAIYDRNGVPLAVDVKAVAIAVDSFNMTKPEALVEILSEELGHSSGDLTPLVYRRSYFTWIDRAVDLEAAKRIERRAQDVFAYGLIFIDTWKRCYPQGSLASNLLGFVGMDGHGLEGMELAFDEALSGTPTMLHVLKGADGRTYNTKMIEEGIPGEDLYLTIDARLQLVCEEEIDNGVARFRANTGFIVLLDPKSGDLLAMAQDRRYDLNYFWRSTAEERRNLAISFLFEPGSSFKALTGLAALDCGAVHPEDTFNGNDGIRIAGHTMHNSDNESFGTVTFAKTIEYSVNTAMIRVAQRLGGEEYGILRDVNDWSKLALAATSIGQSVGVTGIQLARGMAVVANGGYLLAPRIVQGLGAEGQSPKEPIVLRHVASQESCATMCGLLRTVVESGTGTRADIPGFDVAGKTGTAQKALPGRGYVDGKYTSIFVGFLPAEEPTYLALVVLDEVKTTPVWGGYTAGSIFHDAASRIVLIEHLPPVASLEAQLEQHKESTTSIQDTRLSSASSPPAWLQLP